MTDEQSFIRAICLSPLDPLPRLVFADWLEEHDQPERAEFVRLQCDGPCSVCNGCGEVGYGRGSPKVACPAPPCFRERELWDGPVGVAIIRELGAVWDDALHCSILLDGRPQGERDVDRCFVVSRGFVSHISLPLAAFLTHADAVFRSQPIEAVTLTDREPNGGFPWMWALASTDEMPRDLTLFERYRDALPLAIFRELTGGDDIGPTHRAYDSPESAMQFLSAACVRYGRRLAGLPELAPV